MKSTLQADAYVVLLQARRDLAERRLARGALALSPRGNRTSPTSSDAAALDPVGAIDRAAYIHRASINVVALCGRLFSAAIGGGVIAKWSDDPGRTKAQVLEVFDRVIEGLRVEMGGAP